MELVKKMIHFNDAGKKVTAQFFLDEDYNVPDAKNDVGRIVLSEGKLRVGRAAAYGKLSEDIWQAVYFPFCM